MRKNKIKYRELGPDEQERGRDDWFSRVQGRPHEGTVAGRAH